MRHFTLDSLRLISAYAVIALHVCALYVTSTAVGSAHWWTGNIIDSTLRWCVPFFVMITGALLVPSLQQATSSANYYRKRMAILIPFLFWVLFYLLYHAAAKQFLLGESYDMGAAIGALLTQPPHYHLWYLYMIFPLLLIAPALRRATNLRLLAFTLLLFPALIWFAQFFEMLPRTPLLLRWLEFLGYFIAGHLLFTARVRMSKRLLTFIALIVALMIAALTYHHCSNAICSFSPYYDYHSPLVIILSLSLFALLVCSFEGITPSARSSRTVERLTPLALGIYLIHPIFIDIALRLAPPADSPLLMLPISILVVSILSTAAAAFMQRIPLLQRVISLR